MRRPPIASRLALALGLCLAVVTGVEAADGTHLGDAAMALNPGEWMTLVTSGASAAFECPTANCATKNILPYSDDLVWDERRGKALYIGSDHIFDCSVPHSQRLVQFLESTMTYTRLADPPRFATCGTQHGYGLQAMDPATGDYYHVPPGENWDLWKLPAGSSTWVELSPPHPYKNQMGPPLSAIEHFPEMNSLVFVQNGVVALYNLATATWSLLATGLNVGELHAVAKYNPVTKAVYFGGGITPIGTTFYRLTSDGTITALGSWPVSVVQYNEVVFTVEPAGGDMLLFTSTGGTRRFHAYKPSTNAWTQQPDPPMWSTVYGANKQASNVIAAPISTYGVNMFVTCDFGTCTTRLYKHSWTPPRPVGGHAMPSLNDEINTYARFGWTWSTGQLPNLPADPSYSAGTNVHNTAEGDDLWANLMMYERTGQLGYLDRAVWWLKYFKYDYRACTGPFDKTLCYDRDNFSLDHLYGWGLVAWYERTGDNYALEEAEALAAMAETLWASRTPGVYKVAEWGPRGPARHLLLATRVAEATGKQRWINLRNRLIDFFMLSPDWDAARGMYFYGPDNTASVTGDPNAYANGARVMSPFEIGVVSDAFFHAIRVTNRQDMKDRVIAMARFVDTHALEPTSQYTGHFFGVRSGQPWQKMGEASGFYTTSFVNLLMTACRYGAGSTWCDRAKHFFNRGEKSVYGSFTLPLTREASDTAVGHFSMTQFDTSLESDYFLRNKGELQYSWLIFETPDPAPPAAPTGLRVIQQ